MWYSEKWNDYPCESTIPSVCSDVRGQNVTFVYINIPMTWTEAQSYCRAHHTDLASVRNMTENQKVVELIPSGRKVWIGLFRHLSWSDGQIYSFHYWENTKLDGAGENCVAANFADSGKWSGVGCDSDLTFICYSQSAQRHVMKAKLEAMEPNSNLDVDDFTETRNPVAAQTEAGPKKEQRYQTELEQGVRWKSLPQGQEGRNRAGENPGEEQSPQGGSQSGNGEGNPGGNGGGNGGGNPG
ncbi:putative C-type lectin domain family 20 member A, partial [Amphiprion ocellaris]|uniref:putative C-type lectin domain family 20 member A n=1 Tax=Amphiprion ocellaris TaxID=80972 RepID=UPI002410CC6B